MVGWPFKKEKKTRIETASETEVIIDNIKKSNLERKSEASRNLVALKERKVILPTLNKIAKYMYNSLRALEKSLGDKGNVEYRQKLITEEELWNLLTSTTDIKRAREILKDIINLIDQEDGLVSSVKMTTFKELSFRPA